MNHRVTFDRESTSAAPSSTRSSACSATTTVTQRPTSLPSSPTRTTPRRVQPPRAGGRGHMAETGDPAGHAKAQDMGLARLDCLAWRKRLQRSSF